MISKSLELSLIGINVSLNQHIEQSNAHNQFAYRKNDEIGSMGLEGVCAYAKSLNDGWKDLITHEEE